MTVSRWQFCYISGFVLFVELHQEGPVPTACVVGLFSFYIKKQKFWYFFQSWERKKNLLRRIGLSIKKKQCFAFVFSIKGLNPQILWAGTKQISLPLLKISFLFFLIYRNTFWNANSIGVNFNVNIHFISFSYKMCGKYKKKKRAEKGNIRQKKRV